MASHQLDEVLDARAQIRELRKRVIETKADWQRSQERAQRGQRSARGCLTSSAKAGTAPLRPGRNATQQAGPEA